MTPGKPARWCRCSRRRDLHAADADSLIYTVIQAPQNGAVVINPDGTFTYTPNAALAVAGGTDQFHVTVSDSTYFHLLHLGGGHTVAATLGVTAKAFTTVTDTVTVGTSPFGVAISPDGTRVYVANVVGTVSVIDAATNMVTATVPVGNAPQGVAVSPDGTLVYVIDAVTREALRVDQSITVSGRQGGGGGCTGSLDEVGQLSQPGCSGGRRTVSRS